MGRQMTVGIDYTSRDYASIKQDMIDMLQKKIPEYTDTSETDAGIVLLECFAMGIDIVSFYLDTQANETMLYTCEQRKSALNWCKILGYTPRSTSSAHVMQVFRLTSPQSYRVTIPAGTIVKTEPKDSLDKLLYFITESDLTIRAGDLGDEIDEKSGKYKYQVSAIQGLPVTNEILGSSTGAKNQTFTLAYFPVVKESVVVQVKESETDWVTWKPVSDFADSNFASRHYQIDILNDDKAVIRFGDGNTGKIPTTDFTNNIRVSYINGGGVVGNVSDHVVTAMHTSNPLVAKTFNPEAVYRRGEEKESLSSIKVNAPNYNRIKWGVMTEDDFKDIMPVLFKDVLYSHAVKSSNNIDDMDIYIMLKDGEYLTDGRISEMTKALEDRKLVGVRNINIMRMNTLKVDMSCSLVVDDNYSRNSAKERVENYIKKYFEIGSLDIQQSIASIDIESYVYRNIQGVRSFRITQPSDLVVEVPQGSVAVLNSLTIEATGGV